VREGLVFHAGTALDDAGMAITNGGRVLALTSLADSMEEALAISYGNAERISFEGKQFRRDIGFDLKVPESSAR
ncbi:MAG: phosphoribosylglycinamide synthetase C domain-containing protein, partial [Flavobacteriales bacterium]